MFALYSLFPVILTYGGATLYNLSLLTSDIYAIIVSIILFNHFPNFLFYISLVFVMVGLLCYNLKNEINSNDTPIEPQEYPDGNEDRIVDLDRESKEIIGEERHENIKLLS